MPGGEVAFLIQKQRMQQIFFLKIMRNCRFKLRDFLRMFTQQLLSELAQRGHAYTQNPRRINRRNQLRSELRQLWFGKLTDCLRD